MGLWGLVVWAGQVIRLWDYILVVVFLKAISDLWQDHRATYRQQYGDDETRIRRRLERERFILPKGASFDDLYARRNVPNIGELINIALEAIEDVNRAKLEGVFATSTSIPKPILAARKTATAASKTCWRISPSLPWICALPG